jgi:hypothetical protein
LLKGRWPGHQDSARIEEATMSKRRLSSRAATATRRRRRRRSAGDQDAGSGTPPARRDVFVLGEMIALRPEVARILS